MNTNFNRLHRFLEVILISAICGVSLNLYATEFMGIDEIKPGMKGYGLTVFKGTKIDTFQVEIIDVMRKRLPKGDVILSEISGGIVDTAGVISGMSGSPIYIDGKLIGALAYSYGAFPKKALAGITPINEMLNPPSGGYGVPGGKFSPIKIPLCCPGLDEGIIQELKEAIPCFNVRKVEGSGGIFDDSILPFPGSPLGIPLVMGDINWYGVGTCTYKEGNKVWGFGHPMSALGETELPMTAGYIYSIVPSLYDSYKMGAPTKIIGTIKNDNERGIIGVIGKIPDLIDFNLKINPPKAESGGEKFHYRIVKEKAYFPSLFRGLTFYSIYTGFKGTGEMTMEVDLEIEGSRDFQFNNLYTGTIIDISKSIARVFGLIWNNPFQEVEIDKISMNLVSSNQIKLAKIERLSVDKKEIKTGDSLNLVLLLSSYQEGLVKQHISIKIPSWSKKGKLTLSIEGGDAIRNEDIVNIKTIDGLARWLTTAPSDNELVLRLTQKGKSTWIIGERFPSLPPSRSSFLKGDIEEKDVILEKRIKTEWVIKGEKSIELEVK